MMGRVSSGCLQRKPLLGVVAALLLASCSGSKHGSIPPKHQGAQVGSASIDPTLHQPPRLFHTAIDEAFWASHSTQVDRVVATGARLEVSPRNGEIVVAAWDLDLARKNDVLVGSLAVAPHLGGGFVHWSRTQLFRSDTFAGPLRPIHTVATLGADTIRGARNGLDSILVFGDTSVGALVGTNDSLSPPPFAGIADFAALDARRAVRTDILGLLASTIDGGKTWTNASMFGIGAKAFSVEPDAIKIYTWQGRSQWNADGSFGALEQSYSNPRRGQNFTTTFAGSRIEDTTSWWAWREMAPVHAAVLAGVRVSDTRALAIATNSFAEVDLTTGELARAMTDWPPAGLSCSTVPGNPERLFICGWDSYQGYGSYVLRASGTDWPPTIEHAFSDDGIFVASEDGALAFGGSCSFTPKYLDPNDTSRMEFGSEPRLSTKICIRRSAGEWAEHDIVVDPNDTLQGWVPSRDGTAVAIVTPSEIAPMPDPVDDPNRVSMQGAIKVIRIPRDFDGFALSSPQANPYGSAGRSPAGPLVDRRLQLRDDGSVEAWLTMAPNNDPGGGMHAGAVIDVRGNVTVYPPPPRAVAVIATGDQGIALLDDGRLAETIDHGRSYRSGGLSPVPASAFSGYCSPLGCVVGPVVRLGWGTPTMTPTVHTQKLDPPVKTNPTLHLDCSSRSTVAVLDDLALFKGANTSWPTGYGDALALVREVENLPDAAPDQPQVPPSGDVDVEPAVPTPPKKGKPNRGSGQTRTMSLLFRPPFDPRAVPKRLDATGSNLENIRRGAVFPLLDKQGEVSLLLISDKHEILITSETLTTLPLFESRRYLAADTNYAGGLLLGPNQPLVINEVRRRTTLEEHGFGTQKAPVYLGQERDSSTRRQFGLARNDSDGIALVVWDGSPAGVASVSEFDQQSRTFRAASPLAPWTTATMADDPRCKAQRGWQLVMPIDPSAWFDVKLLVNLGVRLGTTGNMLVRWTQERLCIEAIDVGLGTRSGYEWRYDNHLVIRWQQTSKQPRAATLVTDGVHRPLDCRIVTETEVRKP